MKKVQSTKKTALFVQKNWKRVTKRLCRCGGQVTVKKKDISLGNVLYENVPFTFCPKCGHQKEIALVMMAAQQYAEAYGLESIDCSLFCHRTITFRGDNNV
ncbi:hypothetical protein [Aneurinibacillus thermoaerophilus]|jgi:hypothetical protein|uniref:hypothetical protein n=1 Tax=Aneurinibacillus thermoaerophilus TaxID=143495 RepID=UPI002E251A1D|nr:hypothetical protein [Aneurinibacillus thermoaerophilus]